MLRGVMNCDFKIRTLSVRGEEHGKLLVEWLLKRNRETPAVAPMIDWTLGLANVHKAEMKDVSKAPTHA